SWGTLAALTDITLKVLPRPETEASLLLLGLDDDTAVQALSAAMGSTGEVSGAAHLPAGSAARLGVAGLGKDAVTALRLGGVALVGAAVAAAGGHATLIRAPAAVRASVGVFDPLDPVVAALTQRINAQFDPEGVLNPGRMYAGI